MKLQLTSPYTESVSQVHEPSTTRDSSPSQQPRWLAPQERDAWLRLVGVVIKLPTALDAQLQRDAGISLFEYQVLAGLSEAPDRMLRMSDLAELTNGSLSRLSHVVKRLGSRGWVRREPCPEDGRSTNAILTDEGLAKITATAPGHVDTVRRLVIDALTAAQVRSLREIGTRILQQVDPADTFRLRRAAPDAPAPGQERSR
ncbi:MAG: MarR family transcriptional regulator [Dactylosporangium sp.]|nr:MarR family transcriptional regulator [Dactylosporangium sp.]NNJ62418.1 MarR family transcriptional regulator [Dactylosporangium sp.]